MSEKLDPEDVTEIMNGCFALMEATIHAYGGTVDKYIGDCIMASFGVPLPADDHPVRAVNASLAMRASLEDFNRARELPVPLRTHIGVNSGTVLAGHVGGEVKRELTVVGEVVEVADILKDVAPNGTVYVGEDTFARTHETFAYGPRQTTEFHGRSVTAYDVQTDAPTSAGTETADIATVASDRDSDRRRATVVFAEIAGLATTGDPSAEELALVNRCFAAMEEAVRAHGGTIDKFLGGIVMALFGAPVAIEGAPRQALNAAIAMRQRLEAFNRDHGRALVMHAGVNSGLVLAGMVGGEAKRDFTVMGDTVNLASRLKDAAADHVILVGPETYRFTREDFDFEPPRSLTLKGKALAVSAYELRSAERSLHRHRLAGSDQQIFSPLIGRDRELAAIEARIAQVRNGTGGIISIAADAGLGKSRLMAEISALTQLADVTFLEGRCVSLGQSLSFHPFVDLFRGWANAPEEEGDESAVHKLEDAVRAVAPDQVEEIAPFLAALMGVHLSSVADIEGEALEKLIFHAVRELLQRLAAQGPLVLVFEDLHWADLSSIKLLESLLRLVTQHPIVFVHAFRPGHADTSERMLALVQQELGEQHLELHLEPLDNKACDELVGNLLRIDNLPFSTRALISRRAEGNPFYIEEVVRSLIEQGIVQQVGDRLELTAEIDASRIPGTVQEVVMARVDRLPETSRQVLQLAAVLGRNFYDRNVLDILGTTVDCPGELQQLAERQLIREHSSRRTGSTKRLLLQTEREHVFTHALVQETVYGSILQRTRRELHLRAAESIERVFANRLVDFYGMLAYHFGRAEHLEKAEEYLFKAGDEAARSAASNEALNFFREAARLYQLLHGDGGDPRKKALLEKNIGVALIARGRLPESVEHLDEALRHLGEPVPQRSLTVQLGFAKDIASVLLHLYARGGRPGRRIARELDREVLAVRYNRARAQTTSDPQRFFFDTIGTLRRMNQLDPSGIDDASGMYAGTAILFSYSGVSFAIARKILGIGRHLVRDGNPRDEFVYQHYSWIHHHIAGDWSDQHTIEDELVEQNIRHGQLWDVQTYLGMLGEQRIHQGKLDAAGAIRDKLGDIADGYGLDWARSNQYALDMWMLLQRRELAPALDALDRYYHSRDEELLNLLALGTRAKIQVLQGDHEAAGATLAKARELIRPGVVAPYYLTYTLMSQLMHDITRVEQAQAAGDRSALRTARRCAKRSLRAELSCAAKVSWERTEAYHLAGRLASILGHQKRAVRWWTRSVAEGERLGQTPEVARTYATAGKLLGSRQMNGLSAEACLQRARELFASVGLEHEAEHATATGQRAA